MKYWLVVVNPEIVCGCVVPNPTTGEYSTISPLKNPWLLKFIVFCEVEIPVGLTKSFLFVNDPPSIIFISETVFVADSITNLCIPLVESFAKEIWLDSLK